MLRGLSVDVVHRVVTSPEQIVAEQNGKSAYQSRVEFGGKMFLVRVIVADDTEPKTVVTVYRTSNIAKYWRM